MIPAEAVEAAAGVIALGEMEKTPYLKVARAALEAAEPFMQGASIECCARAWDMGMSVGEQYGAVTERAYEWGASRDVEPPSNPYRTTK